MKKLFLLDAYALIYRAYYALIRTPRITSRGLNTSAAFGFCNTLDDILRKENPSHIAVCFDPKGSTFRHEVYPEYKAQRDKQPEDITLAIPYIKKILRAMNIAVVELEGYEADDIIGTLSRQAEREDFDTYMMTPDKDYAQLVTDRVWMYRPALRGEGFEVRGPKEVCERYGVERPLQVIDLLALEGDVSDNVPGCPGVGEKTAKKLIADFGSVENLLDNVESLTGALKKRVAENAEKILFSKFLVTIKTDVPLDGISIDDFKRTEPDTEALRAVYTELEFKSFLSRLGAAPASPAPAPAPEPGTMGSLFDLPETSAEAQIAECPVGSYRAADDAADVVAEALTNPTVGIALYATGDQAMSARLRGIAIADKECSATYINIPLDARRREVIDALRPLFDGRCRIAGNDIKRDMLLLRREGIEWRAPYFDTAVAHYLIDSEMKHNLPTLMLRYLRLEAPELPTGMRRWYPPTPMSESEATKRYTIEADMALRLVASLSDEINALGMSTLLDSIELPMVEVLAEMEWTGVRIDTAELSVLSKRLTKQLSDMENEAFALAGAPFNLSSPAQVGEILFGQMKLDPKAKRTSKGQYSTTEAILEKYRHSHPLVDLILKIRKLRKLLATYVDSLPTLINPKTGKIHTTYQQTVAATGRLSSSDPNLQNIPIRTDDGREIRRAFIADPGDLFMSADYSQIELRLIADMSGDPDMTDAFRHGYDIHRATAAKIYHRAFDEVSEDERRRAKTANFGIIYGISAFGLSERLGIPRAEAKALIDGYFRTYPHISEYLTEAVEKARKNGYVETVMGRRRQLPDINSRNAAIRGYAERNAVNAPIQGSAADIIKKAMIAIHREILSRGLKSRMIMQVHDELNFNVVPDELTVMQELVERNMTDAYRATVPLEVSVGVATNWLEAH